MKKTTKVVLGSVMTMALCASLIAGSTLALFSSKDDVNIAITSGKVDVKATVDNLTIASELPGESLDYKALGSAELTIDGDVVLSNFAPGDYANVDIKVTNNSTIFVKWNLTVSLGEGSSEELYNALDFDNTSEIYCSRGEGIGTTLDIKDFKVTHIIDFVFGNKTIYPVNGQ